MFSIICDIQNSQAPLVMEHKKTNIFRPTFFVLSVSLSCVLSLSSHSSFASLSSAVRNSKCSWSIVFLLSYHLYSCTIHWPYSLLCRFPQFHSHIVDKYVRSYAKQVCVSIHLNRTSKGNHKRWAQFPSTFIWMVLCGSFCLSLAFWMSA